MSLRILILCIPFSRFYTRLESEVEAKCFLLQMLECGHSLQHRPPIRPWAFEEAPCFIAGSFRFPVFRWAPGFLWLESRLDPLIESLCKWKDRLVFAELVTPKSSGWVHVHTGSVSASPDAILLRGGGLNHYQSRSRERKWCQLKGKRDLKKRKTLPDTSDLRFLCVMEMIHTS